MDRFRYRWHTGTKWVGEAHGRAFRRGPLSCPFLERGRARIGRCSPGPRRMTCTFRPLATNDAGTGLAGPARMKLALASALLGVVVQAASPGPAVHDKAFWRQIVASHYAVPEGSSDAELTTELSGLLGNPDP